MGFLDKLLGRREGHPLPPPAATDAAFSSAPAYAAADAHAIERYRYLLRTAPPDALEQVHAEAFGRLTPEQRAQVLRELSSALPPEETRHAVAEGYDPHSLARFATRAEQRRPGILERLFGSGRNSFAGYGGGFGSSGVGTSLASSFLAGAVGSLAAQELFRHVGHASEIEPHAFADEGADEGAYIAEDEGFGDDDFNGDYEI